MLYTYNDKFTPNKWSIRDFTLKGECQSSITGPKFQTKVYSAYMVICILVFYVPKFSPLDIKHTHKQ